MVGGGDPSPSRRVAAEAELREFCGTQASLERAIEIARKQGAKSPELRATTSLARLLRDTGRREAFDTADPKDAKALLDELGGSR